MDLAKGTPALEARHIYDNMPFQNMESQFRSRSQNGVRHAEPGRGFDASGGQPIRLLYPVRTTELAQVELDLNTGYYVNDSSNSSNSSVCSELLDQGIEEDKTLHVSDMSDQ